MSDLHTPGPWKVSSERPLFGCWSVRQDPLNWDGNGYQHICSVPASTKGTHYGEMFRANARLISAAPDLLAALKAMVDRWEPDCDGQDRIMWENARDAIAKATLSSGVGERAGSQDSGSAE